jgi:hypothetical protein
LIIRHGQKEHAEDGRPGNQHHQLGWRETPTDPAVALRLGARRDPVTVSGDHSVGRAATPSSERQIASGRA